MASDSFPPLDHLGYGLDLTTVNPMGVDGVVNSLKKFAAIVDIDPDDRTKEHTIGGVKYKIPRLVSATEDIKSAAGSLETYTSGSKASEAFNLDASLSVTYGAISGSASAAYGYNKTFKEDTMFALYSASSSVYHASLRNYGPHLNEDDLKFSLEKLPLNFDGNNKDHVNAYRAFFHVWGSHLVVGCSYGSRFQLTIKQTKSESTDSSHWSANVNAAYTGVVSAKGDVNIEDKKSFESFKSEKLVEVSVRGGDIKLAQTLSRTKDTSADDFGEWDKTSQTNPDITNFTTEELWSLLKFARSDDVSKYATGLESAFNWIISHPQLYKTDLTFNIESDWAEFGLLTPGARIENPEKLKEDNTVATPLKIMWGQEHSHDQKRKVIQFSIVNDGAPIDFYISHGSDGGASGKGEARILVNAKTYENVGIGDNNWNTKRFFQVAVNGTPALGDQLPPKPPTKPKLAYYARAPNPLPSKPSTDLKATKDPLYPKQTDSKEIYVIFGDHSPHFGPVDEPGFDQYPSHSMQEDKLPPGFPTNSNTTYAGPPGRLPPDLKLPTATKEKETYI